MKYLVAFSLIACVGSFFGNGSSTAWANEKSCEELLFLKAEESSPEEAWLAEFKSHWDSQSVTFSRRQKKTWSEALEHLLSDLKEVSAMSSSKDKTLKLHLEKAVAKLPEIQLAFQSLEQADRKAKYFKQAYEVIWATLSVHSHEIMDAKTKTMDYRRFFTILRAIEDFDSEKAEFSFYKIRRAVEGRFSVSEFVRCKI